MGTDPRADVLAEFRVVARRFCAQLAETAEGRALLREALGDVRLVDTVAPAGNDGDVRRSHLHAEASSCASVGCRRVWVERATADAPRAGDTSP